jgi:hypothetical protein
MNLFIFVCWAVSPFVGDASQIFPGDQRRVLKTGASPSAALILDVDRDGDNDIVVANGRDGTVSVFLGDGRGDFRQAAGSRAPAGSNPNDIATADFNNDGRPDLAIANHDTDYVTVLIGNGRGAFAPASSSPLRVPSRPHPHGIAAGDLNGDGRADLVVESWEEDAVIPIWGDGRGGFSIGPKVAVGDHPYHKVRIADVNADGRLDIVTANIESSNVTVLLGNGSGGFADGPGSPLPAGSSPFGVAVGDVDGQAGPDIVVVNRGGSSRDSSSDAVHILLRQGDRFRPAMRPAVALGRSPTNVAVGDVDGDGISDIAVGNWASHDVTLMLGGRSGFRAAPGSPYAVGAPPADVVLGDLNGDGAADLVACKYDDSTVLVFLTRFRSAGL